jgi:cold shock CspA family protein
MPLRGVLRTWNEDRGFGFIAPAHGGAELFVHIQSFPADGTHPTVGERLAYELGRDRDGRPRAVKVLRLVFEQIPKASPAVEVQGQATGAPRCDGRTVCSRMASCAEAK